MYSVLGSKPSAERPLVWDDTDEFFERRNWLLQDITEKGQIAAAIAPLIGSLRAHCGASSS